MNHAVAPSPIYISHWSPHVLSGSTSKRGRASGRSRQGYESLATPQRCYSLFVVRAGNAEVMQADGSKRRFTGPVALLFAPSQPLSLRLSGMSDYSWIDWGVIAQERERVPGQRRWRYCDQQSQPQLSSCFNVDVPFRLDDRLIEGADRLCRAINGLWWRSDMDLLRTQALLGSWLVELLTYYSQTPASPSPQESEERVADLIKMADLQLEQQLTVRGWAQLAGISPATLNNHIRQTYGKSAGEMLTSLRLARAQHCLQSGKSVQETAYNCGFSSRTAFSAWYKRHAGQSPRYSKMPT